MNEKKLKEILEKHELWVNSFGKLGERADLRKVDLRDTNLSGANLREANLSGADLSGADLGDTDLKWADLSRADLRYVDLRDAVLRCADLREANLTDAVLRNAVLKYADLSGADLSRADLSGADLSRADLRYADLSRADLTDAVLREAYLSGANLADAKVNSRTAGYHLQCPEEGSFIAFKKCENDTIVKLLIPEDAKRSSATSRKCRASKAVVLDITDKNGNQIETVASAYDSDFIYQVGEVVEVENFDENRWNECSTGVHFFLTRREAEIY